MRKQGVDASLGLRWIEDELGLSVFLGHCVVVVDGDRSIGIPVCPHTHSKDHEIDRENQGRARD